jgi:hypothetical protein
MDYLEIPTHKMVAESKKLCEENLINTISNHKSY